MKTFRFLHTGLAVLLILVGLKMIAADRFAIPTHVTLAVIAMVLAVSVGASVLFPESSDQGASRDKPGP
jgi:tellurite resistance protein TerC